MWTPNGRLVTVGTKFKSNLHYCQQNKSKKSWNISIFNGAGYFKTSTAYCKINLGLVCSQVILGMKTRLDSIQKLFKYYISRFDQRLGGVASCLLFLSESTEFERYLEPLPGCMELSACRSIE